MKKRNRKTKGLFGLLTLSIVAMLTACGGSSTSSSNLSNNTNSDTSDSVDIPDEIDSSNEETTVIKETDTTLTDEEKIVDIPTEAIKIELSDNKTNSGTGYSVSDNVVTISSDGAYVISGTLSNGSIVIKKNIYAHLFLNNVDITSLTGSPIIFKKDSSHTNPSVVTLVSGTENKLIDANLETYTSGDEADDGTFDNNATFYSKRSITFNGDGTLSVLSNYHQGIRVKGDLSILAGNVAINAYDHAIKGDDNIYFLGGTINATSTNGDGVKTDEPSETDVYDGTLYNAKFKDVNLTIDSKYDGIQVENNVLFDGGTYSITTYGGLKNRASYEKDYEYDDNGNIVYEDGEAQLNSCKAVKTGYDWTESMVDGYSSIIVESGTFTIDAVDDAFNANNMMIVNGGEFKIQAGDDGMHADALFEFNDGTIDITTCYEGLEAANMTFNGGTANIVATDDGINASNKHSTITDDMAYDSACQMYFNGSQIYVYADGDGIDSNGAAQFNKGNIVVEGPSSGANSAIDTNGGYVINGGTIIAAGTSEMLELAKNNSSQYSATLSVAITKGNVIKITDSNDNVIGTYTASKSASCLTFSSSDLVLNGTYNLYVDGTLKTSWKQTVLVYSNVTATNGQNEGQPGGSGQPGGGNNPGPHN